MAEAGFINYYRCPSCSHEWRNLWDSHCDDDCPKCGMRHVSPYRWADPPAPEPLKKLFDPEKATGHQRMVHSFMSFNRWDYWTPHQITNQMASEVGELCDTVNALYGPKPPKPGEEPDEELELGDVYFAVICYANSRGIDLDTALKRSTDKFFRRDKDRFKEQPDEQRP